MGNDVGGKLCVKHFIISIHVPAWGTTVYVSDIDVGIMHFNPRSRVGNDLPPDSENVNPMHFNPRSRVGNDGQSQTQMAQ